MAAVNVFFYDQDIGQRSMGCFPNSPNMLQVVNFHVTSALIQKAHLPSRHRFWEL